MVNTLNILGFPHAYELSAPPDSSPVLVFVHGWLLSRAYWQPVIQQLSESYSCLSYDMRGFGDSQLAATERIKANLAKSISSTVPDAVLETAGIGTRESAMETAIGGSFGMVPSGIPSLTLSPTQRSRYTPAAYANDLVLLLQQLQITKAWLIGHSLGGSIALWAADQAPETIAGVVCVNSGGGIYLKEEFERFRTAGQQIINFRPRWFNYVPFLDLMLSRFNVAQPIDRGWGRQRLVDLLKAQPEAALGTLLDSTTEAEVHLLPQVVFRLRQPVYFIAGAKDAIIEPQYVHHLASFHSSFESCGNNVSEIPNCGHLAMVEQPEAVVSKIRSVLAKHL
jgi:2-succinyl-6-hydroxy-2,4-cyclohexadiene-1-carboxylate synthase